MVDISPTAANEIKRLQSSRYLESDCFLRLTIRSGGCSGLFYVLRIESATITLPTGSHVLKIADITLVIDVDSWKYIENLRIDYSEDLMGGGFRFYNSQAENICGCGISFAQKQQKIESGQKRG
jgi:iron-sulfur cluster assembly protein